MLNLAAAVDEYAHLAADVVADFRESPSKLVCHQRVSRHTAPKQTIELANLTRLETVGVPEDFDTNPPSKLVGPHSADLSTRSRTDAVRLAWTRTMEFLQHESPETRPTLWRLPGHLRHVHALAPLRRRGRRLRNDGNPLQIQTESLHMDG